MRTYLAAFILSLSLTTIAWASPLILKCNINGQITGINVDSLVSNDCKSKTVNNQGGQIQIRYQVTLCGGQHAEGTVEVLTSNGDWVSTHEFSTEKNCYLFREIATNYPCTPNRYGHRGGCE